MLERLLDYSLSHRIATFVLTVVLLAVGLFAFKNLTIEAFPDPTDTQVQIITLFSGQPTEEVERRVSLPLERALNGTPGLTRLRSISLFGLSFVTMTFDDATDPDARPSASHRAHGRRGAAGRSAPDPRPVRDADRRDLSLHAGEHEVRSDDAAHPAGLGDLAAAAAGARRRRRRLLRRSGARGPRRTGREQDGRPGRQPERRLRGAQEGQRQRHRRLRRARLGDVRHPQPRHLQQHRRFAARARRLQQDSPGRAARRGQGQRGLRAAPRRRDARLESRTRWKASC